MTTLLALGLVAVISAALLISGSAMRRQSRRLPPLLVPATLLDCGCLRIGGGLVVFCAAHDPAAEPPVEQWAAEMGDQQ